MLLRTSKRFYNKLRTCVLWTVGVVLGGHGNYALYVYICKYMSVIYIYIFVCALCVYIHMCIYTYVCIYIYVCVYIYIHICLCVNIYILIFINIYIYIILGGLLSVHLSIYLVLLRVCVRQDCIRAHKVSVPVETIRYVRMRQHAR